MEIICHRRNTVFELLNTSKGHGVEIDIRSMDGRLILSHDPMSGGDDFEAWLEHYDHGTLILNVKEEGLEEYILHILSSRNITNYFFLDQSFPFLVKYSEHCKRRCAARFSDYESIETVFNLRGIAGWVWVDYFSNFPISKDDQVRLHEWGFKICLVSPELQGFHSSRLDEYKKYLNENDISFDYVCTRLAEEWSGYE